MSDPFSQHGAFSWGELMTTDVAGAKQFYTDLLGWQLNTQPAPDGNGEYTIIEVEGQGIGGIMDMPKDAPPMPPAWAMYVTVDDVDARTAKVESLGGKVLVPPMDIPTVGRFSVIQDPQGAILNLMTYADPA